MTPGMTFKFSGHQTFAFRYGWLEKGIRGVEEHPDLFIRDDALVLLGVGKNMVESIRHWCQVAQLIEPGPDVGKNTARSLQPTGIARKLLLNGAWDPFLEDDASLWLIHWLIATNPSIGTAWQILFARYNRPDFTRREITSYIHDFAAKEGLRVSDSVIARDVDCLIRTYVAGSGSNKQAVAEETFACPLLQINLISPHLTEKCIGSQSAQNLLCPLRCSLTPCMITSDAESRTETMSIRSVFTGSEPRTGVQT